MKTEYSSPPRKELEVLDFVRGLQTADHAVLFYTDINDCHQVLFTFLKVGIGKGEAAVYVVGQETPSKIRKEMEKFGMNVKGYEMVGALKIVNYDEWYITSGRVDVPNIVKLWRNAVDEAKERGFKGVRACGEMSCFFRHNLVNELVEYERACDRRLRIPMTAICTYDLNLIGPFRENLFTNLLKAHSHVLFAEPEIEVNAILGAVDDVLDKAFGSLAKGVLFTTLKNRFGLEREEIPKKFTVFCGALEKVFGNTPAGLLENMIFRELYLKLKEQRTWR